MNQSLDAFNSYAIPSTRQRMTLALSVSPNPTYNTQAPGQNQHPLSSTPSPPAPTPRGNVFPQRSPTTLITPKSPFFSNTTPSASANGLEHEIQERDEAEALAAKEADKKKTGWARLMR
jgi:hypothetical protein